MKKSEVNAILPSLPLGKAKVSFQIKYDKSVLGTLELSRGSVQWYSKNKQTSTCNLNWKEFAALMENV